MLESYLPDLQDSFFAIQDRSSDIMGGFPDSIPGDMGM